MDMVWTLNSDPFLNMPAKCVALTGISGEFRSSGFWHIEYSFEYRPIQKGGPVPSRDGLNINIPDLPGWAYIWAEFTTIKRDNDNDPDTPPEVKRIVNRVHVAEIYDTSDFNTQLYINGGL